MEILNILLTFGIMYLTSQILIVILKYFKNLIQSEQLIVEKNDKYFGLAFSVLLIIGFLYFQKKDVILGLQLGLLITLFWGLLILFIKFIVHISDMFSVKHQRIEGINSKGFKIAKGTKLKPYYWRDIKWIKFDKEKFRLIFKEKNKVVIDKKTQNLYLLLKNIPLGFKDFDYEYIDSFFSNLTTCVVCGAVAFNDSKCLSCSCTNWTNVLEKEYLNYEEYVKANQLEIFATMEKNEKFSDFKIIDKNFKFDSNWTPMVTKTEVLTYSEKEFWEKE